MPKPIKPRHQVVIISDHAWYERWPERAGKKIKRSKLVRVIQSKLTNKAQGEGINLDKTGATWIEVFTNVWANVRLTDRGWLVTTFVYKDNQIAV